ncbi:MAG: uroporphyrinogen decarboxylase [Pseudomonadota bacterium]
MEAPEAKTTASLFLQTLGGASSTIPPMWFMRQAGRYLPEYRALREKAGSFLDLCFSPDMASEVTLQPIDRFDLDAAILFADILLIPHALGQSLSFVAGEGPQLAPPTRAADLDAYQKRDVVEPLSPVFETVRKTRERLADDKALIGFAGAPWTVATYMLEGRSSRDPSVLRLRYYQDPDFITSLMAILVDKTVDYLIAQIDAGADAIQLFDTWAGGLPRDVLKVLSLDPMMAISKAVKKARPDTPVIMFPKGVGEKAVDYALSPQTDAIGVDTAMEPSWAREYLSRHTVVQGGLDPLVVVAGGDMMREAVSAILNQFDGAPYIFNLGHGFVPATPPEHVADLVAYVRSGDWRSAKKDARR